MRSRIVSHTRKPTKFFIIAGALSILIAAAAQADPGRPIEALRDGKTTVAGEPYIKTVAELAKDILGDDASARGLARGAIRRLTGREAAELLALLPPAFDAKSKTVNWEIVSAYDGLGDIARARHYADLLSAIDPETPKEANKAMQKIRPSPEQRENVVRALFLVFDDPTTRESLRFTTASQLIKYGASERLAVRITPMLDDPIRKVRTHAVALLRMSNMPSEFAIPRLEQALDNSMSMVVDHAISALFSKHRPEYAHEIATKKTLELIMTADNFTRMGLFDKLNINRAQASSAVAPLKAYLDSPRTHEVIYAIQALAELQDVASSAIEPLTVLAREANPATRRFATNALECIRERFCRDRLDFRNAASSLP